MGSARVQYELERTLPTLQLAVEHGLFDKNVEARSITQKRRQFENALVRHNALVADFHRYVDYEENLETLRVLRIERLGDASKIPRADLQHMQQKTTAHIVSIFERGIKRLRHEYGLWHRYMVWAARRKMRSAVSRIAARALALFPNNLDLWLFVADNALNQTMDVTTSRALLQRALRLNGIAHKHNIAARANQRASGKRARTGKDRAAPPPLAIRPAGDAEEDTPTLYVPKQEQDVVRLWLEYFRMELVFLERLRRRRAVLNILDEDEDDEDAASGTDGPASSGKDAEGDGSSVPVNDEGERAPISIDQIVDEEDGDQKNDAPTQSIILGAIPIAALKSALSLDSTTAMAPQSHFSFLLALSQMILAFPFYGDEASKTIEASLTNAVVEAMHNRFPDHPTAMLFSSAMPIFQATRKNNVARLSKVEQSEELESSLLLQRASRLAHKKIREMSDVQQSTGPSGRQAAESDDGPFEMDPRSKLLERIAASLSAVGKALPVVSLTRTMLDHLHTSILALAHPTDAHMSTMLRLAERLRLLGDELSMGDHYAAFLTANVKRVLRDCKRLGNAGKEVKQAKLLTTLNALRARHPAATTVAELEAAVATALGEYQREADVAYLYIAADALLISASLYTDTKRVAHSDAAWKFILKEIRSKNNVRLWRVWAAWLDRTGASIPASRGKPWRAATLKHALMTDTVGESAVQEELLKHLYSQERTPADVARTLAWIDRQAIARAGFWRFVVETECGRAAEERAEALEMVKEAYEKLIESTGSVDELGAFISFLAIEAGLPIEAMKRFTKENVALGRTDVVGQARLQEMWQATVKELRKLDLAKEGETQKKDPSGEQVANVSEEGSGGESDGGDSDNDDEDEDDEDE